MTPRKQSTSKSAMESPNIERVIAHYTPRP